MLFPGWDHALPAQGCLLVDKTCQICERFVCRFAYGGINFDAVGGVFVGSFIFTQVAQIRVGSIVKPAVWAHCTLEHYALLVAFVPVSELVSNPRFLEWLYQCKQADRLVVDKNTI